MDRVSLQLRENQTATFEVRPDPSGFVIEGSHIKGQAQPVGEHSWQVQVGVQTFEAWVLDFDPDTCTARLRIGSKTVVATIDPLKMRYLRLIGIDQAALRKADDLKAPMPGLIREVLVEAGQQIAAGDSLVVLEAMKMENVLKAAADGVVAEIPVDAGQAVEKGALLVRFE